MLSNHPQSSSVNSLWICVTVPEEEEECNKSCKFLHIHNLVWNENRDCFYVAGIQYSKGRQLHIGEILRVGRVAAVWVCGENWHVFVRLLLYSHTVGGWLIFTLYINFIHHACITMWERKEGRKDLVCSTQPGLLLRSLIFTSVYQIYFHLPQCTVHCIIYWVPAWCTFTTQWYLKLWRGFF